MITVYVGKTEVSIADPISLQDFLLKQGYTQSYFAVALNSQFVPRDQYSKQLLNHQDVIDIITPMQGG